MAFAVKNFQPKIVVIGAGRVGGHLAKRLAEKGLPPAQIFSRFAEHSGQLAGVVRAAQVLDFQKIMPDADWYILAVPDAAIGQVADQLAALKISGLVTHCSGATPVEVLAKHFPRSGVFWPMQSFSENYPPRWPGLPICLDAATLADCQFLEKMARRLGCKPFIVNELQRAQLHLAAVFANNFTNHCLTISEKILGEVGLPLAVLHPLVRATFEKALANSPAQSQTGPAARGDAETLARQLALLENHPDWQRVYREISASIQSV